MGSSSPFFVPSTVLKEINENWSVDYPKILEECGGVVRKEEIVRQAPIVKTYEQIKIVSESVKSQEVNKSSNEVSEG